MHHTDRRFPLYDINMFAWLMAPTVPTLHSFQTNAQVEGKLLHARVLDDFFGLPAKSKVKRKKNQEHDVSAEDLGFPYKPTYPLAKRTRKGINQRLAHLSEWRTGRKRSWPNRYFMRLARKCARYVRWLEKNGHGEDLEVKQATELLARALAA